MTPPCLLADAARSSRRTIYLWLGVIVGLAFVLGLIALWLSEGNSWQHKR